MPAIYSCTVHSISVLFVYESACISIFLFIYRGNHSGVPMCFVMSFFLLLFCWNIYSYKWYCCILRVFIYTVKDWKFHISCRIQSIYLLFLYCIIKMQLISCHSSVLMTYFFIFSKWIPEGSIDFAPSTLCIGISSLLNILSITSNSSLPMGKWSLSYQPYIGVACTIHCTFQKKLWHLRWMLKYFLYLICTSILEIIVEVKFEMKLNTVTI